MKIIGKFVLYVFIGVGVALAGAAGGYYAARHVLLAAAGERAEAQATFIEPNQLLVEFPALVRGRIVRCSVWADTRRKALSVMC